MPRKGYLTRQFTYKGVHYRVYAKTEKEAKEKIRKKKALIKEEEKRMSNLSVEEWALMAVETYKSHYKDVTMDRYLGRMKCCILKYIGKKKLTEIKPIDCQRLVNKQSGKCKTQTNEVYNQLKFIFHTAKVNGHIVNDPTETLVKVKGYTHTRRPISDEERKALYDAAEKNHEYDIYIFSLTCGCRPSEARELKHNDLYKIDDIPVLHIRGTKTEKSDRIVPCPTFLYERYSSEEETYIFTTNRKTPLTQRTYDNRTHRLYRDMSVRDAGFTPYALRHTYCTDLARKGIDIRTAQKLMGHATINMTANIYTHLDQKDILKFASTIVGE